MAFRSGEDLLLHGDIILNIISARNLAKGVLCSEYLRCCSGSCDSVSRITDRRLQHLHHNHAGTTIDPYVSVRISGVVVARTTAIHNCNEPEWNEDFRIPLAYYSSSLELMIKDEGILGAKMIGMATIPTSTFISGEPFDSWLPVLGFLGRPVEPDAALHVSLQFVHVDDNEMYRHGITGDPERRGVENVYFPLRKGGMVKLYQDAHVKIGELPEIKLDGDKVFTHEKCWEDICHAILEARHFIYIVGWSIFEKVILVREQTKNFPLLFQTFGDLLKYKSHEGVRVCMLIWGDTKKGVTNTGDEEETRKFFKHSSVKCVLSPRYSSSKLKVLGTIFTHHQKCIILDTAASSEVRRNASSEGKRKISAFIGGLDISHGRYDTPEHRLFKDFNSVFSGDIRNPTFDTKEKGPRQPWHDLHCKIEGPAAYDILTNFEQRWKKTTNSSDGSLIKIDGVSWIDSPSPTCTDPYGDPRVRVSEEDDPDNWHVQVFRSINSGSVKGFPLYDNHAEIKSHNLVRGRSLLIDRSIHTAYVKAIRSAKHFIYIENQYFIGSSYGWPSYTSADSNNLIPMELALKIVEKIRKKERFCVYIVIPMWPEGNPASAVGQEILFWQGQTMTMMYELIGRELGSSGSNENMHPQDYLNFYCLGNREISKSNDFPNISSENNNRTSAIALARRHRRFMIHVHSKGMIVDDEYIILGSANINQRSLAGSRDTEIAMAAYQPYHTWASCDNNNHPRGQVYGYRKSLWAEHLGGLDSRFDEPESLACVKHVNKIASDNWDRYTQEENVSLKGHLIKYPITVESNGAVGPLAGFECFPDVGGKVLGGPSYFPDELTM